jgi:hypothetical protein
VPRLVVNADVLAEAHKGVTDHNIPATGAPRDDVGNTGNIDGSAAGEPE